MNKEVANVLRDRLITLPFVDLLGGMVQTLTKVNVDDFNGKTSTQRFPVTDSIFGADHCEGKEIGMMPDDSKKSIIYFEDFGISENGSRRGSPGFTSNIRLVCWMNRAKLTGGTYDAISGVAISSILAQIINKNPVNVGIFVRFTCSLSRIQPQDSGLFGRYSYNEPYQQYLRPPFEFFGIDLVCKYFVYKNCLAEIEWNNPKCF